MRWGSGEGVIKNGELGGLRRKQL